MYLHEVPERASFASIRVTGCPAFAGGGECLRFHLARAPCPRVGSEGTPHQPTAGADESFTGLVARYCVLAMAGAGVADWIADCWLSASCQRLSRFTQTRILA